MQQSNARKEGRYGKIAPLHQSHRQTRSRLTIGLLAFLLSVVLGNVQARGQVDPLLEESWHLTARNQEPAGANVRSAWSATKGENVVIGIVDDGLQYGHPDLQPNYQSAFSFDFNDNDPDPSPDSAVDFHGTAVAGVAGARGGNGLGGSGVAPASALAGLRLTAAPSSDFQEAQAFGYKSEAIHISNNSWGPIDNGRALDGPGPLAQEAIATAATQGRGGKGRIFIWAAGNGRQNSDNCNFDGYANNRFMITVGAVDNTGRQAWYSEPCSALFVAAPADGGAKGIITTDVMGEPGYAPGDYTSAFGGTSSAASLVSGVAALILARNPTLTRRDVQHILAKSAVKIDATDAGWTTGLFAHNEKYGFGLIDAQKAVSLAANWIKLPTDIIKLETVQNLLPTAIPDNNGAGVTKNIVISGEPNGFSVEHVEVEVDISHPYRGDLDITLTSPSGVESHLATPRSADDGNNFSSWRFVSVRHWGESATGTWTLRVADQGALDEGTWNTWTLRIFGMGAPQPAQSFTLTVSKAGDGSGTVSGPGIECGADCQESYASGTGVGLTATPTAGSTFDGWSGHADCEDGQLTMDGARNCVATFTRITFPLTVSKAGNGSGMVSGPGIGCGADCQESYASGTGVGLTATPAAGSTFSGWGGHADCGDGQVTMDEAKTCVAAFARLTFPLTVSKAGNGSGMVSGPGIECGADCLESYVSGTGVGLTATPAAGSTFGGWGGHADCGDGQLTMDDARNCVATFTRPPSTAFITLVQGENTIWPIGNVQIIQWRSNRVQGNVRIELSRDSGASWEVLFRNTGNDGFQRWLIKGPRTRQALIKVSSISDPTISDTSDAPYTIAGGWVTVLYPNGEESLTVNTKKLIRWNGVGPRIVRIELSRDGGASWETIVQNTGNDGFHRWTVNGPPTDRAVIRIRGAQDAEVVDISNGVFTIR